MRGDGRRHHPARPGGLAVARRPVAAEPSQGRDRRRRDRPRRLRPDLGRAGIDRQQRTGRRVGERRRQHRRRRPAGRSRIAGLAVRSAVGTGRKRRRPRIHRVVRGDRRFRQPDLRQRERVGRARQGQRHRTARGHAREGHRGSAGALDRHAAGDHADLQRHPRRSRGTQEAGIGDPARRGPVPRNGFASDARASAPAADLADLPRELDRGARRAPGVATRLDLDERIRRLPRERATTGRIQHDHAARGAADEIDREPRALLPCRPAEPVEERCGGLRSRFRALDVLDPAEVVDRSSFATSSRTAITTPNITNPNTCSLTNEEPIAISGPGRVYDGATRLDGRSSSRCGP